ncbi:hypothetical protein C0989_006673, partial [Termitomyces sp. Mn162]
DPEPQISAPDPKELVGTDHPASCPLGHQHSGAHQSATQTCLPTDTTLRNTTSTQTNYAARMNLAPLTPTNEEGPAAFATSAGIRARSQEDLRPPPTNCTAKKTKALNPLDTRGRFEGPPSDTNTAHIPAADQKKPLHPWSEILRIELNTTLRNATELHWRTPTTPAGPWEPSLRCPAPSQQTPGLASTDGTSGRNPCLWIH